MGRQQIDGLAAHARACHPSGGRVRECLPDSGIAGILFKPLERLQADTRVGIVRYRVSINACLTTSESALSFRTPIDSTPDTRDSILHARRSEARCLNARSSMIAG